MQLQGAMTLAEKAGYDWATTSMQCVATESGFKIYELPPKSNEQREYLIIPEEGHPNANFADLQNSLSKKLGINLDSITILHTNLESSVINGQYVPPFSYISVAV